MEYPGLATYLAPFCRGDDESRVGRIRSAQGGHIRNKGARINRCDEKIGFMQPDS